MRTLIARFCVVFSGGYCRRCCRYCGLFGHKPSGGMVPNTRTQPHCTGLVQRFCQIGPLATHAADLLPLLHILAGPDGECGGAQQFPSKIWPSHPLDNHKSALSCGRNLNATDLTHEHDVVHDFPQLPQVGSDFLVLDVAELSGGSILASRIHPEQRAAHRRVVKSLRHAGCRVQTLNIPELAAVRMDSVLGFALIVKGVRRVLAFPSWICADPFHDFCVALG